MKSVRVYNNVALHLLLVIGLVTAVLGQICNVTYEENPHGSGPCPSSYYYNDYTVYWTGSVSGPVAYVSVTASGGPCGADILCVDGSDYLVTCEGYFEQPISGPLGFTGAYFTASGVYLTSNTESYSCPPGDPGLNGYGFSTYCYPLFRDINTIGWNGSC
jgi:hypothetical protein